MRALRTYLLVFLLFAASSALVVGLTIGVLSNSVTDGLEAGAVAGLAGGALITVPLAVLDVVGDRGRRAGEPYGPRQEATVSVVPGDDLPDRIQEALRGLHAEIRGADIAAGRYAARTRWSWRSFGEDITVQLSGDRAAPVAHIRSRPVIRSTLIDYGKARHNVRQVVAALEARTEEA